MDKEQAVLGIVVVVDDEGSIIRPLERLLQDLLAEENLPYQIIASQSPREILERLEKSPGDLAVVISDLMMEPMNGLEFLRAVKARHPETQLIALTGYASDHNTFNLLQQEIELYSYQKKPWDDEQLERIIKNALDSYRRQKLLNLYVPKEVVKEVLEHPGDNILEGTETEATILFLDFRDSTELFHSEVMEAKAALKHLNLYFEEILAVFDKYTNGFLDKFVGDGIMAVFGVPPSISKTPGHDARDAVLAAIDMKERVQRLNTQQTQMPLGIGIGISTGRVIAGNVGTDKRANYTVLGDNVNIASRLEKAAKPIKNGILISHNTYMYVKDIVQVRPYTSLPAKGKRGRLAVYEVLGHVAACAGAAQS
jgi:class 3 adenylate cyclase